MTHFQFMFVISPQVTKIPYGIFLKCAWKDSDKYLVKDMLMFGKSWSIEQMFNDTEIQNLVSNRYPEPVPRLQSSEKRGRKRRRVYACSSHKSSKKGMGEDGDHREFNPSGTRVWYHSNSPLKASR